MTVGVYTITHLDTGMFYIGSTGNYLHRRNSHMYNLRHNKHHVVKLQNAFNVNDRVIWNIIPVATLEESRILERKMLSEQKDNKLLCNKRMIGLRKVRVAKTKPTTRRVWSDVVKAKMSATRTGMSKSAAWVDKIMNSVRRVVSVEGVEYRSMTEAALAHNISIQLASHRFKSTNKKWDRWIAL